MSGEYESRYPGNLSELSSSNLGGVKALRQVTHGIFRRHQSCKCVRMEHALKGIGREQLEADIGSRHCDGSSRHLCQTVGHNGGDTFVHHTALERVEE